VDGIDRENNGMWEDMMVEVKMVKESARGMVLVSHWTDDGAVMSRQAHRKREELTKSGCSRGHTTFACRNFSCST
jgi:hypothetical protein